MTNLTFLLRALITLSAIPPAEAQDPYQLLRQPSDGFASVMPGRVFTFPNDHYPHEKFKIEWWYLTANLSDSEGNDFGVHWTLFRQAMTAGINQRGWQSNQTWMAHAAVSTPDSFSFSQRFARGGIGQSGVERSDTGSFEAWMDDWLWRSQSDGPFPALLTAGTENHRFQLALSASDKWVLQGKEGYSQKSNLGQASYYYSQPFVEISGTIWVDGSPLEVQGDGWLDREWSSQPLSGNQAGWDWISLHLSDGTALMVYQLRHHSGEHYISGSLARQSGQTTFLEPSDVTLTPVSETTVAFPDGSRTLPLEWEVSVPSLNIEVSVAAVRADNWLGTAFPYWEGPVTVEGSHQGSGYLELTGY